MFYVFRLKDQRREGEAAICRLSEMEGTSAAFHSSISLLFFFPLWCVLSHLKAKGAHTHSLSLLRKQEFCQINPHFLFTGSLKPAAVFTDLVARP